MLHACKHRPLPVHPNITQLIMIPSSVVSLRLQVDKHPYIILFNIIMLNVTSSKPPRDSVPPHQIGICIQDQSYTRTKPTDSMHTNKHSYRSAEHACFGTG